MDNKMAEEIKNAFIVAVCVVVPFTVGYFIGYVTGTKRNDVRNDGRATMKSGNMKAGNIKAGGKISVSQTMNGCGGSMCIGDVTSNGAVNLNQTMSNCDDNYDGLQATTGDINTDENLELHQKIEGGVNPSVTTTVNGTTYRGKRNVDIKNKAVFVDGSSV
jgi:hypothetical protein